MPLSVCIGSDESVVDTFKMSRFGHVSIDTETVSESVSKDTLMCVEHNLAMFPENPPWFMVHFLHTFFFCSISSKSVFRSFAISSNIVFRSYAILAKCISSITIIERNTFLRKNEGSDR